MLIRKPSEDEIDKVLAMAHALRDKGKDKFAMGHTLLYFDEHNKMLEDLRRKVEYFVRFGMEEKALQDMRHALSVLREADEKYSNDDSSLFSGD